MLSILTRAAAAPSTDAQNATNAIVYYGKTAMISSIGAIVIESLTIVSAAYLLFPLYRQGIVKLRTKYLLGMVASDMALGIIGSIPTANYLAGKPLKGGTNACSAVGFILTAVLFTQHLWTLIIAITTYALLKHPISRFTRLLHAYWYIPPIAVWLFAIAHSVAWYVVWGFSPSSGGSLCYYGAGDKPYDRDLVQFIPRAFVFIVVIILYSRLFQFLRRPDTISLSESGKNTSDICRAIAEGQGEKQGRPVATDVFGKLGRTMGFKQKGSSMQPLGDDVPPWELLHLNNVGLDLEKMAIPITRPIEQERRPEQEGPHTWRIPVDDLSRSDRIGTTSTLVGSDSKRNSSSSDPARHIVTAHQVEKVIEEGIVVPSLGMTPGSRSHHSFQSDEPPSPLQLDNKALTDTVSKHNDAQLQRSSDGSMKSTQGDYDEKESREQDEPVEQDLRDFFLANQANNDDGAPTSGSDMRRGESAAAYSNRQASLLMLYFPLAYMFIFAFSLVRLLYNMITSKPNAGLTIASLWFVLSAGLVDAAVYGVAELVIRRRVHRNLPGHLTENPSSPHRAWLQQGSTGRSAVT